MMRVSSDRLVAVVLGRDALEHADRGMCGHRRADHAGGRAADLVGIGLDAELVDVGQAVVERTLVPEAVLAAADAAVAGLDRETGALVPLHRGAGVVGGGALA